MISELLIQLPRGTRKVSFLHIWEHSVVRSLEANLKKEGLDIDGIVISAKTFIDSATIELYYLDSQKTADLIRISKKSVSNIPIDFVTEELTRLKDEVSYIDMDEETRFQYEGFIQSEHANIMELYDYEYISKVEIQRLLTNAKNDIRYGLVNSDGTKILSSNPIDQKDNYLMSSFHRNDQFINFDFIISISTLKEYLETYLLSFIIGMTDESILQETYLKDHDKYLGYSFHIMFGNDVHIGGNIDSQNVPKINLHQLFKVDDIKNMSDGQFTKSLNSCLMFLELFKSSYDFGKDALRFLPQDTQISPLTIDQTMHSITKKDIIAMYQNLIGTINVNNI
ncbi:hypothetical protein D3P96_00130 [Weissella viridescens]|uniref:Uncharacterized protein n=1 Tax=Weissella viridescens TaxID=1629 RepID=A0A3P2RGI7_WEIVI|nr:hypothetical protein [Weissella viridescens]RRG18431.1 hypothetical protein D3P96_00130 [Weissella viridescens]